MLSSKVSLFPSVTNSEPLHIVLFAYNFPPSTTTGSQRPLRFWKYLPENGVVPHVVCTSQYGTRAEMKNVSYVPGPEPAPPMLRLQSDAARVLQRILPHNERLEWVPPAVAAAEDILRRHPVRAVLSTFPPLCTHLAALWFSRKHRLPWAADFRDPLVGNAFRLRSGGIHHEPWAERRIFRDARLLITVTDGILDRWKHRYPEHVGKMRVLWNGYDPAEDLRPFSLAPRSRRVLTYTGTIYGHRHPNLLFESLERLTVNGIVDPSSFAVQLIGPIREDAGVRPIASFKTLHEAGCIEIPGTIPRAEAIRSLQECDYLLLIDTNEMNSGHTVPAKIFEYLRVGRSILAQIPPNSIVERIIRNSGVPATFLYPDDKPEEFDRKVVEFLKSPPVVAEPNDWFKENFDGRRQAAALAERLRGIAGPQPLTPSPQPPQVRRNIAR